MRHEILVGLGIAGILLGSGTDAASHQDQPTHPAAQAALRYFESLQDRHLDAVLDQLRRPAPSPAVRALVIRNLPREGELIPTAREAAKLAVIRPVIAIHGRADDIELRLITIGGLAFVGLHARTVLLISREALGLLDADEMVAVIAHELGHDYVWDEYVKARQEHDDQGLQELELRCDGIAVMTLQKMRVDPARLISAVTKLLRHNERIRTLNYAHYVPLDQRVRFIIAVSRLTDSVRQQPPLR
jgi:hypothetical protein